MFFTRIKWASLGCNVLHYDTMWFTRIQCPSLQHIVLHLKAMYFSKIYCASLVDNMIQFNDLCNILHDTTLYCTWSGASWSRNILQRAGRKVRGGQDSKHLQWTLSTLALHYTSLPLHYTVLPLHYTTLPFHCTALPLQCFHFTVRTCPRCLTWGATCRAAPGRSAACPSPPRPRTAGKFS